MSIVPRTIDEIELRSQMGSARPYAAELGIDFKRQVFDCELTLLYAAEQLEHFFPPDTVMGVLRWFSNFTAQLAVDRADPPEVITVLDYRWVLCLTQLQKAWDTVEKKAIPLHELIEQPPEVSIAINLHGIYVRRVAPLLQIDDSVETTVRRAEDH